MGTGKELKRSLISGYLRITSWLAVQNGDARNGMKASRVLMLH
jgi:hypothetical protein